MNKMDIQLNTAKSIGWGLFGWIVFCVVGILLIGLCTETKAQMMISTHFGSFEEATPDSTIVEHTVGTSGDYTTIALAISGIVASSSDFVSDQKIHKLILIDRKDYNEAVDFDGATTNTDYYWWLTAHDSVKHDGTSGDFARIERSSSGNPIKSSDIKLKVTDLYLALHDGVGTSDEGIRVNNTTSTVYNLEVRNCVIENDANVSTYNSTDGIYVPYGSANVTVENTVIYGFARCGIHAQMYTGSGNTQNWYIRNCTLDNNGDGAQTDNGGITGANNSDSHTINFYVDNTGVFNSYLGRDFLSSLAATQITWSGSYNASGSTVNYHANRTGLSNGLTGLTDTDTDFTSQTLGSEDYHIANTSDLYNAGASLSAYFTDDIDGDTRSGTWDIGADEY